MFCGSISVFLVSLLGVAQFGVLGETTKLRLLDFRACGETSSGLRVVCGVPRCMASPQTRVSRHVARLARLDRRLPRLARLASSTATFRQVAIMVGCQTLHRLRSGAFSAGRSGPSTRLLAQAGPGSLVFSFSGETYPKRGECSPCRC